MLKDACGIRSSQMRSNLDESHEFFHESTCEFKIDSCDQTQIFFSVKKPASFVLAFFSRDLWYRAVGPYLRQSATTPCENGSTLRTIKVSRSLPTKPSSFLSVFSFSFFTSLLLLHMSIYLGLS